ncbi:MAG: phosphoribosylformylglycinamidine synthase, partial [Kiritimatiellae bacterium]|nr:phosphoribosylformylglycinamidine synthase [Kiritimatiellia bacterium]
VAHAEKDLVELDLAGVSSADALERVLHLPAVANKTFLITIADRSITGMVARDQMVGPYQTPVADVAVTATSFKATTGESMAMGERSNIAIIDGPVSGRMAIGESLTNIAASYIGNIKGVKLSANWMCACGEEGEDAALFDTVKAVGMELCPELGISIPVGKDSLSMRTLWQSSNGESHKMIAPLSLVVTAFSAVVDVRKTVTPDLASDAGSSLWLFDLGLGKNRLGGSALAQVYEQVGNEAPDLDDSALFVRFFNAVQEMLGSDLLSAYHDRADGGLAVTLAEMAIAGVVGVDVELSAPGSDPLAVLFAEELGAVIQVSADNVEEFLKVVERFELSDIVTRIGRILPSSLSESPAVRISVDNSLVIDSTVSKLDLIWSELTYKMQALRDNPACAKDEYDAKSDVTDPGMNFVVTFDPDADIVAAANLSSAKPRMAILREQGINGQVEMAGAFDRAGFESVDVHMTDLLSGRIDLSSFQGLVACGGFSYGDVLGAGSGWAKSVLYNENLKAMFAQFFARPETFSLGVCNGCQMLSQLRDIIPGAEHWPSFERNISEQFEARYVTVEIEKSKSIFFTGMEGSRMGIAVAHGEGRVDFSAHGSLQGLEDNGLIAMRYVDNAGNRTERYPLNPNGSPDGITSVTSLDGRATILMPHPERGFRALQLSYRPEGQFEGEAGPWMRMFRNARMFVS